MGANLRAFVILLPAIVLGRAASADQPAVPARPPIELSGQAFGTTYSIKVASPADRIERQDLQNRIAALLAQIDAETSLWREDSELSRLNAYRGDDWFPVSESTARIIAAAVDVTHASGGAFDPTVSPLVQLWSFGPQRQPVRIPSADEIAEARQHLGVSQIEVRLSPPAVRKRDPDVKLDLNAIAKGDAVDRVADLLDALSPRGYLVEIGGEIRTRGTKGNGSPWQIGIEQPTVGRRSVESVIELNDAALATSGDYRNFVEVDGRRFSHTIDPRTGRPIDHALTAVSVVADKCMTADAWATAFMVLGPEEGYRAAEAQGIEALFLVREQGGFTARATPGFPRTRELLANDAQPPDGASITTFLLAILVFGVAIIGMSVGVILSNRRLRGSCGGLSGLKDEKGTPMCDVCTQPAKECDEFRKRMTATSSPPAGSDPIPSRHPDH